jgi:hypothetical protein
MGNDLGQQSPSKASNQAETDCDPEGRLWRRVVVAAETALADHSYVSPIEVLCRMGLLARSWVEDWRKGRIDHLERAIQGTPQKISTSLAMFRAWAQEKGLKPSETRYVRDTRNGIVELRFTQSGDPEIEKSYRTHYMSPALSEIRQRKLQAKLDQAPQTVVFQIIRDSQCSECGVEMEQGDSLLMEADQPLCLACAGLGELEFLPAGNAALTRRATKYSRRAAVVVRFSRSRKRYERQGMLLEPAALAKAERECAQDADQRAAERERGATRRHEEDRALVERMAQQIAASFPGCPPPEARAIAEHTAKRGSGRVGRSAAGRSLNEEALTLALIAAVRHQHTNYDELLARGMDRESARLLVAARINSILAAWRPGD